MAVQYMHDLDLLGVFSLVRAKAQNLSATPAGLGAGDGGRFWYDTTKARFMVWNGTAAVDATDLQFSTGQLDASRIANLVAAITNTKLSALAQPDAPVNFGGQRATNSADGVANTDLATVGQVLAVQALASAAASGVAYKAAVRAVATTNITLSGPQTVDGVALVAGDRVLVAGQSSAAQNGIYTVAAAAWSRSTDADQTGELAPGTQVAVTGGAQPASNGGNADSIWRIVSDAAITPGTTAQTWEKLPGTTTPTFIGGAGLILTGNTFDVGQGLGVLVSADAVGINPQLVRRKLTGIVPSATGTVTCDDGTQIAFTVTGAVVAVVHNLGNRAAVPRLVYHTSPGAGNVQGQPLLPDYTNSADGNTTTMTLVGAPGANQYRFDIDG